MVSFTPQPISAEKEPRYMQNRRLGGPESRHGGKVIEEFLSFGGVLTPDSSACSVITIPPKYVQDELTFLSQYSSLVGCYAVSSG